MSIASVYEGRCLPDWCAEDKRRHGSVPEPRLSRSHFQRRDRRLPEPFFVDEQLAAGRDEPVDRKQFNYLSPGRRAERLPPELPQPEFFEELAAHPARPERPW